MCYFNILEKVGSTPLIELKDSSLDNINLYAKLEFYNPTGSVKDRAASHILKKLLSSGEINKNTTLIESSSGNFGIALSAYCREYGLKFYCVVDPHISPTNEILIKELSTVMIKVDKPDSNGGYLLTRIEKVKELLSTIPNSYWVNQYSNPYNAEAYYNSLGNEICNEIQPIDYIFIGVSSGGTITGLSQKIKEVYPDAKVIAVDIVGSVIFGGPPMKRFIPGIGSGMVPNILKFAKIDDVVMMDEIDTINSCHELLKGHSIFAGGSSGSAFGAVKKYFSNKKFKTKPNVAILLPDRGEKYTNNIYNEHWCDDFINRNYKYKIKCEVRQ